MVDSQYGPRIRSEFELEYLALTTSLSLGKSPPLPRPAAALSLIHSLLCKTRTVPSS